MPPAPVQPDDEVSLTKGPKPPADQKKKPDGSKPGAVVEDQTTAAKPEVSELDLLRRSRLLPPVSQTPCFERAVYIFEYKNRDFLKLLQKSLIEINLEGLKIQNGTERDIRTRKLSEAERADKSLDYIGGVQFIDKSLRVFLLEGISSKGMLRLENRIIKVAANTDTFKIMKDPRLLFDKRIYSEFDVDIKKVKLRTLLKNLLANSETYMPRSVPKDIYDTLMQLKKIREKNTIHEVLASALWPSAKSVVDLERNYGDALNDDDLYGNPPRRKVKRRGQRTTRNEEEAQKSDFASEATSVLSMEDLRESQKKEINGSVKNSLREAEAGASALPGNPSVLGKSDASADLHAAVSGRLI